MLHQARELEPVFYEFFAKCTFIKEKADRIESLPDCIALGKVIKSIREEVKVICSPRSMHFYGILFCDAH